MWGEILGTVLGSYLQADASKDAARTQANAGNAANAQTWQMYQQNREDMMPWRTTGTAALGKLSGLLGLGSARTYDLSKAPPTFNPAAAKQDTIPARITPQEAMTLKALGGAGAQDPRTGAFHFYVENDGNENDGNEKPDGPPARDRNAERASHFGGSDTKGLAEGKYNDGRGNDYGIDAGDRQHTLKDFWTGFKYGGVPGGLGSLAFGSPGSAQINGGGWAGLGPSGQGNGPGAPGREDGHDGSGGPITHPWGASASTTDPWGTMSDADKRSAWDAYYSTQGSTGTPGEWDRNFGLADYQADPGYQFRLGQGTQALERSAAARGGLNSGALGKALQNYGQEMGSQEYGNAYNRWNNDRAQRFNMLSSLAGLGQTATGTIGNWGQNTAGQMGNTLMDIGNANAAGRIGSANAWGNGLNSMINAWNQRSAMNGGGW